MRDLDQTAKKLVAYAAAGGAPPGWLAVASAELFAALLDLEELRRRADRGHLKVLAEVRALERAIERCGGDHRRARAQFPHWSHGQWYLRLALFRAQQNTRGAGLSASFKEHPAMPRKSIPIKTALDPQPQRYASGKPPAPASIETRPTDDGGMSTGETGGNFTPPTVSTGAGQPQQGLDVENPDE